LFPFLGKYKFFLFIFSYNINTSFIEVKKIKKGANMKLNQNNLLLKELEKPYVAYIDSYSYIGLWDENFLFIDKEGKMLPISEAIQDEFISDIGSSVSTRDAITFNIANLKEIKDCYNYLTLGDVFYYNMSKITENKTKRIEITYFSPAFEKYIPDLIKGERDNEEKTKLVFIYNPSILKDKGFYSREEFINDFLIKDMRYSMDSAKEVLSWINS
jgi:hypothetical protein